MILNYLEKMVFPGLFIIRTIHNNLFCNLDHHGNPFCLDISTIFIMKSIKQ